MILQSFQFFQSLYHQCLDFLESASLFRQKMLSYNRHLIGLVPTTLPFTLVLQREEVPFELELIGKLHT